MNKPDQSIRVELHFFDSCPSYKRAWGDLLDVITEAQLDVTVRPVNIDSVEKAGELKFAGSPTIRVNGHDLEEYSGPGVMACRVYQENRNQGWPSKTLLKQKLVAANQVA
jgi:hypothetical protein